LRKIPGRICRPARFLAEAAHIPRKLRRVVRCGPLLGHAASAGIAPASRGTASSSRVECGCTGPSALCRSNGTTASRRASVEVVADSLFSSFQRPRTALISSSVGLMHFDLRLGIRQGRFCRVVLSSPNVLEPPARPLRKRQDRLQPLRLSQRIRNASCVLCFQRRILPLIRAPPWVLAGNSLAVSIHWRARSFNPPPRDPVFPRWMFWALRASALRCSIHRQSCQRRGMRGSERRLTLFC